MLFSGKWIELEIMMLSNINQTQKHKFHVFSLIYGIKKGDMKVGGRLLLDKRTGTRL